MLKLTYDQLKRIVLEQLNKKEEEVWNKSFKTVFDDIPSEHEDDEDSNRDDFCEDDGREFRWFIFKNKETGKEYCINYQYSPYGSFLIEKESEISDQTGIVFVEKTEESFFGNE